MLIVKTLELLYKGAKKCPSQDIVNTRQYETVKVNETRNKMKQLFIGKNGALLRRGSVVNICIYIFVLYVHRNR